RRLVAQDRNERHAPRGTEAVAALRKGSSGARSAGSSGTGGPPRKTITKVYYSNGKSVKWRERETAQLCGDFWGARAGKRTNHARAQQPVFRHRGRSRPLRSDPTLEPFRVKASPIKGGRKHEDSRVSLPRRRLASAQPTWLAG